MNTSCQFCQHSAFQSKPDNMWCSSWNSHFLASHCTLLLFIAGEHCNLCPRDRELRGTGWPNVGESWLCQGRLTGLLRSLGVHLLIMKGTQILTLVLHGSWWLYIRHVHLCSKFGTRGGGSDYFPSTVLNRLSCALENFSEETEWKKSVWVGEALLLGRNNLMHQYKLWDELLERTSERRIWLLWSKRINIYRVGVKSMETGSFQWHPETREGAIGTNWNIASSIWTWGRTSYWKITTYKG